MLETIGFMELNSIAKGIEAADCILKAADTHLVLARPGCPGKYYILCYGEVAAVKAALEAASNTAQSFVVDRCVIPRVHPQVIRAVNASSVPQALQSLGIMEFYSVTASVYAADAAVKAADVELLEIRLGTGIGGKSFVVLTGEVAAVTEAVDCGIQCENAKGMLVSQVVIPHPERELYGFLL